MANYFCDECKKAFPSVSELNKHYLEHIQLLKNNAKVEREKDKEIPRDSTVSGLDKIKAELMKTLEIVTLTQAVKNMSASQDSLKQFREFKKVDSELKEEYLSEIPESTESADSDTSLMDLINLFNIGKNNNGPATNASFTEASKSSKKEKSK